MHINFHHPNPKILLLSTRQSTLFLPALPYLCSSNNLSNGLTKCHYFRHNISPYTKPPRLSIKLTLPLLPARAQLLLASTLACPQLTYPTILRLVKTTVSLVFCYCQITEQNTAKLPNDFQPNLRKPILTTAAKHKQHYPQLQHYPYIHTHTPICLRTHIHTYKTPILITPNNPTFQLYLFSPQINVF